VSAGTVSLTGARTARRVIPGRYRPVPDLTPPEVARFYASMLAAGHGMLWGGEINNGGYGRFPIWRGGTRIRLLAHRVSFKLATGKDPGQLVIRHLCDTPPCCTPDCFLVGTQADNIRDAIIRRRLNVDGLSAFRAIRIAQTVARTGAGSKLCTWCGQVKDLPDFEIAPGSPDGRAYWCQACAADHQFAPGRMTATDRLCLTGASAVTIAVRPQRPERTALRRGAVTGTLTRPFDRGPRAVRAAYPVPAMASGRTR
jgi:hypothetical protein